jgi:hypothetical protein
MDQGAVSSTDHMSAAIGVVKTGIKAAVLKTEEGTFVGEVGVRLAAGWAEVVFEVGDVGGGVCGAHCPVGLTFRDIDGFSRLASLSLVIAMKAG